MHSGDARGHSQAQGWGLRPLQGCVWVSASGFGGRSLPLEGTRLQVLRAAGCGQGACCVAVKWQACLATAGE